MRNKQNNGNDLFLQRDHQWVVPFSQGDTTLKPLLGGKGANIAEMLRVGLPVPPGFTITTEACNAYYKYDQQFPEGMWSQAKSALAAVEEGTGRVFGDSDNPLLVSVRSGAAVSMPGMMDTVLNLGLTDETVEGLASQTQDRRFALDSYRRFIQMFGQIVMNISGDKFERVLARYKRQTAGGLDSELTESQLEDVIIAYKRIVLSDKHGQEFPQDAYLQLRMTISAVFDSWNRPRAIEYRRIHNIPSDLGTAVNVQSMVFGNMGDDSGTGVAFTRNPATGEKALFGEYLLNAQGEDVVAGIRTPKTVQQLNDEMPDTFAQLRDIARQLESHYGDMQDIEFTIERGRLWLLQTRTGKRTGTAAVRIAVEMVDEGVIDRDTALLRVDAVQLNQLLHPMVSPRAEKNLLARGLPASPGAAVGRVVFEPDDAVRFAADDEKVILVRNETSPDDFHGMAAAEAVLTVHGGMTSHAAVVARGMGKPCVVGAGGLTIIEHDGVMRVDDVTVRRGDWVTIDGSSGEIMVGQVDIVQPELGEYYKTLMTWADEVRELKIRANADTGHDAQIARDFGAQGIGLCRTEHMFFGEERLSIMRQMILADNLADREAALDKLLPIQRQDFIEIFRVMAGLPVTIRLIDPPLHEFLPDRDELQTELAQLKLSLQNAESFEKIDHYLEDIWDKERLLNRVNQLREANPMLGHRGCRLGIVYPEVIRMQTRAIMEAACQVASEDIDVIPEIMVPLVALDIELAVHREIIIEVAEQVMGEYGMKMDYRVGTMIELPRAALTADQIAKHADFFSFGTNDLTQTVFGLSRDDSNRFLPHYVAHDYMPHDPFQVLDTAGVGKVIETGMTLGRQTKPDLKIGICGEHGGDPASISFCQQQGMNYVSCSPFRVPIARLAAAQAILKQRT